LGPRQAYSVNVCQTYFDALIAWKVYPGNPCHTFCLPSFPVWLQCSIRMHLRAVPNLLFF